MRIAQQINELLKPYQVEVHFTKESLNDLSSYDKNQQEKIIALIIKRGMRGPLIKPQGIGEPLRDELKGYTKIKPKNMALRIVYRPVVNDEMICMEIIAIGPRDKEKVYRLAARRLQSFDQQRE
ncbi:type II toxin-antitoxin system RelE family toxin [Laceyella tengchongensis]